MDFQYSIIDIFLVLVKSIGEEKKKSNTLRGIDKSPINNNINTKNIYIS